jgi:hypothetical protein
MSTYSSYSMYTRQNVWWCQYICHADSWIPCRSECPVYSFFICFTALFELHGGLCSVDWRHHYERWNAKVIAVAIMTCCKIRFQHLIKGTEILCDQIRIWDHPSA